MKDIIFEWDNNKDKSNVKKHGISFDEAQTAFYDFNSKSFYDPDHSENENRFILLGLSAKLKILTVCHCIRKNESIIRIISARKSTKKEKKYYEGGKQ